MRYKTTIGIIFAWILLTVGIAFLTTDRPLPYILATFTTGLLVVAIILWMARRIAADMRRRMDEIRDELDLDDPKDFH